MNVIQKMSLIGLALIFLYAPDASAVTVVTNFIGGTPPANASGGGNLTEIFNAAARMWQSAYADPITITLQFDSAGPTEPKA